MAAATASILTRNECRQILHSSSPFCPSPSMLFKPVCARARSTRWYSIQQYAEVFGFVKALATKRFWWREWWQNRLLAFSAVAGYGKSVERRNSPRKCRSPSSRLRANFRHIWNTLTGRPVDLMPSEVFYY